MRDRIRLRSEQKWRPSICLKNRKQSRITLKLKILEKTNTHYKVALELECPIKKMNAQTILETVRPIPTSCGFGHALCPRRPFCSQYILIKETEITAEIFFNIIHHHHHCSNRPHYSCCIFHLPSLQLRLYNQCGLLHSSVHCKFARSHPHLFECILICNRGFPMLAHGLFWIIMIRSELSNIKRV